MPPAARITDMHVCPMVNPGPVPHVGGPIAMGAPTVFTGKLPQARVGDMAICVGPPDTIAKGSSGVFVTKRPAARLGDNTAHGGVIVAGLPTVIIGETGGGGGGGGGLSAGVSSNGFMGGGLAAVALAEAPTMAQTLMSAAMAGTPFCEICFINALKVLSKLLIKPPPTEDLGQYSKSIRIDGDAQFVEDTRKALKAIASTKTGARLLAQLDEKGFPITISEADQGNELEPGNLSGWLKDDGSKGSGSASTVFYNPNGKIPGTEPWQKRPPAIGLAHELIHALHASSGELDSNLIDNDNRRDAKPPHAVIQKPAEEIRTVGISPFESEEISENRIRQEWTPPQPARPWY